MPRKINADVSLDHLEAEASFTLAMLKADPNAQDLAGLATSWSGRIQEIRTLEQSFAQEEADTDATRIVGNRYLDRTCVRFGDDLFFAVSKDRSSPRWQKFFTVPVSEFVRQPLSQQVAYVGAWLATTDEVLERYREELTSWYTQCDGALKKGSELTVRRRDLWATRESFAMEFTQERDKVHRTLADRAQERGLGRDWAGTFFRVEARKSQSMDTSQPSPQPAIA